MKRLLEIILYLSVTFGLLTLCSCSKDEIQKVYVEEVKIESATYSDFPLNPIITTDNLFENDDFYSVLNDDSTPEDYIKVFLLDAKRHGVNLPEYDEYEIKIQIIQTPLSYGGWSNESCNPYVIDITINSIWDNMYFNGRDKSRPEWVDYLPYQKLKLMYHELGHEFGLNHTCIPEGHIMGGDDGSGCNDEGDIDLDNYVNLWILKHNAEDLTYDWGRAVDDMFSLVDQNMFECKGGKWL